MIIVVPDDMVKPLGEIIVALREGAPIELISKTLHQHREDERILVDPTYNQNREWMRQAPPPLKPPPLKERADGLAWEEDQLSREEKALAAEMDEQNRQLVRDAMARDRNFR